MTLTALDGPATNDTSQRYRAVDIDQHFLEPESMWDEYLPAKFRGMGPTHHVDSMGVSRLVVGGVTLPRLPKIPLPVATKGTGFEESGISDSKTHYGMDQRRAQAGWDPAVRLEFMDAENVAAAVIYPTVALHFAALTDIELVVALCQAYNNWVADYCRTAPDRLIAAAVLPQLDVHASVAEARRAADELGLRGVMLRPNPVGRTVEDAAWEPLWALLDERALPLTFHEGVSLSLPTLGLDRSENWIFQHMCAHPFEHMSAMMMMIGAGILERHPNLKCSFIEAGCGWVPYWLERMEHHFETPYRAMQLPLTPTEYFHRQCLVSADAEENKGVTAFVDALGADNLCWSTDFPHPDHIWGGLVGHFVERGDLSEADKRKIVGENAARFYHL
jgi:predicted TIM-barrel fold metal-dependent hydrolase